MTIKDFANFKFESTSGNLATVHVTGQAGDRAALNVAWKNKPTQADTREFEAAFQKATQAKVAASQIHTNKQEALQAGRDWLTHNAEQN